METEDPFSGLLTVIPSVLRRSRTLAAVDPVHSVPLSDDPLTVIFTASEHTPPVPHALTCTVWLPLPALTVAPIVELSTIVVLEPLSSE